MILTVQKKANNSGNALQMQIDFENKTYKRGYFLTRFYDVKQLTAAQLNALESWIKNNNFKKMED